MIRFFKQKTAYDIEYGLVGSEMCIRDRYMAISALEIPVEEAPAEAWQIFYAELAQVAKAQGCLLYTSDAADERSSVDLGGRRIIKKTH